eukprot:364257-Chlamydomonas_euryale.AAC.3
MVDTHARASAHSRYALPLHSMKPCGVSEKRTSSQGMSASSMSFSSSSITSAGSERVSSEPDQIRRGVEMFMPGSIPVASADAGLPW